MNPQHFYDLIVDPSITLLDRYFGVPDSDEARVMCMCIPGQESNWNARVQFGGPARGYSQFEEGGGVYGVLNHASTSQLIRTICNAIDIDTVDEATIYEAMAWSSFLNMTMTRLLLLTDPRPLPPLGDVDGSYAYYDNLWRPGSKRPLDWPGNYETTLAIVRGAPLDPVLEEQA